MTFETRSGWACALLLYLALAGVIAGERQVSSQARSDQNDTAGVEFVTAQELKAKLARNEPVTILDVRATDSFIDSDGKIKGAIHVKTRRLRHRLTQPPFRDLPRDNEIVIYCACPNDEASIRAAQFIAASGFKRAKVLKGGWRAWLDGRGQVESKPRGM